MNVETLLTPERRQAAAEEQALRRVRLGHLVLSDPSQIKHRWGVERERSAVAQLQAISDSGRPDAQRETELLEQIAVGKAAQGLFHQAAALSQSPIAKAEYEAKAKAMQPPGMRQCSCPPTYAQKIPGQGKGRIEKSLLPVEYLWTGTQSILLTRCVLCGIYSALLQGHPECRQLPAPRAGVGDTSGGVATAGDNTR